MNQNNINFANMSNGSSNQQYNLERKRQKVTGDVQKDEQPVVPDPKGVAKASPNFKDIPKDDEQDAEAKAKALAENTKKV
jgi:hypothetical protein